MAKEELRFDDDKIYRYTPLLVFGDDVGKIELIMTKEIFIECYKKWIEPQAEREKRNDRR
jgi:hypothetical protein